jgi:WD40 repeat protein
MDNIRLIYRQHVLDYVKKITNLPQLDKTHLQSVTNADRTINTKDTILCLGELEQENMVAVGHRDTGVQIFNTSTGELICSYPSLAKVSSLSYVSPEKMIVCSFDTRMVKIFDWKKLKVSPKKHLTGTDISWGQRNLTTFGDRYFFVGCDSKCYLGDIQLCKELVVFDSDAKVLCVELLPGNRIAAGNAHNNIHIFDFKRTNEITKLQGHTDQVVTMTLIDSATLCSGSFDGAIRVWDVNNYNCKLVIPDAHEGYVRQVATLGNGLIVSVGEDGKVKIWDITNGDCVATYTHGISRVLNVVYKNGLLITTDVQGVIKIWTITPPNAVQGSSGEQPIDG